MPRTLRMSQPILDNASRKFTHLFILLKPNSVNSIKERQLRGPDLGPRNGCVGDELKYLGFLARLMYSFNQACAVRVAPHIVLPHLGQL